MEAPKKGEIWQHSVRKTNYEIMEPEFTLQSDTALDYAPCVLYRALDGSNRSWGRPVAEFMGKDKNGNQRFTKNEDVVLRETSMKSSLGCLPDTPS
jgi:hypothetical protein